MSAKIYPLTGANCGKKNIPGTTTKLWVTCSCELPDGMPQTVAQLGGAAQGDTKKYGAAFDFSNAGVGFGYWRAFDIKIKTGMVEDLLEGELGSKEFANVLDFEIIGADAVQREWADLMVELDGCGIAMAKDKNGNHIVVGDTDNPCEILAGAKMTTGKASGDSRGGVFQLRAETGYTSMLYDAVTFGIDTTPNP